MHDVREKNKKVLNTVKKFRNFKTLRARAKSFSTKLVHSWGLKVFPVTTETKFFCHNNFSFHEKTPRVDMWNKNDPYFSFQESFMCGNKPTWHNYSSWYMLSWRSMQLKNFQLVILFLNWITLSKNKRRGNSFIVSW